MVEPFVTAIPEQALQDLRERIALTRWPAAIGNDDWEAGAALSYMRPLLDRWQNGFDWRVFERRLNTFAQFRTEIDGHHIHFFHQRGKGPHPFPLVITHGWPGTVIELLPIIPLLTDPASHGGDAGDAFDVVAPSIPGYGFSTLPGPGVNAYRIAELWAEMMTRLGYQRFGAQGGDWGASVSTCLGLRSSDRVAGIHLNYIPGSYRPSLDANCRPLSGGEEAFLALQSEWAQSEGGYAAIQRTRPQTLGYALNDSPVGLAAWIAEKLRAWTDCDGDLDRYFSKDEVLAIVTLYWVTQSMPSAVRLYFEMRQRPMHFQAGEQVRVPCGIARFAKEAPFPPRDWVERGYHVVRWSEFRYGGHFPAWEQPDVLARDIREFFRPLRAATA